MVAIHDRHPNTLRLRRAIVAHSRARYAEGPLLQRGWGTVYSYPRRPGDPWWLALPVWLAPLGAYDHSGVQLRLGHHLLTFGWITGVHDDGPCPACGCPASEFDGHCCEDYGG